MTKEEAKSFLINISYNFGNMGAEYLTEKDGEKMRQAIEILQQEPCDKCVYSTSEGCQHDDITETIPPFETSDDAISRQAVIDLLENTNNGWIINKVLQLPHVTPQPKIGHWINAKVGRFFPSNDFKYCNHCGIRMVEPQEGSEK